jgi:hypothetical protein
MDYDGKDKARQFSLTGVQVPTNSRRGVAVSFIKPLASALAWRGTDRQSAVVGAGRDRN